MASPEAAGDCSNAELLLALHHRAESSDAIWKYVLEMMPVIPKSHLSGQAYWLLNPASRLTTGQRLPTCLAGDFHWQQAETMLHIMQHKLSLRWALKIASSPLVHHAALQAIDIFILPFNTEAICKP